MFMPNVPKDLYISDPSQLTVGMTLWSVGQGGISTVQKPYETGIVIAINFTTDVGFTIVPKEGWILMQSKGVYTKNFLHGTSMLDHHILPQTYNNWYFCASLEAAEALYKFMKDEWNSNPSYEEARRVRELDNRWE